MAFEFHQFEMYLQKKVMVCNVSFSCGLGNEKKSTSVYQLKDRTIGTDIFNHEHKFGCLYWFFNLPEELTC
jgi:hypothetical protein